MDIEHEDFSPPNRDQLWHYICFVAVLSGIIILTGIYVLDRLYPSPII